MPGNYVERRKILSCSEKFSSKLLYNSKPWATTLLKPGCGNKEVPWSSKTIGTYTRWKSYPKYILYQQNELFLGYEKKNICFIHSQATSEWEIRYLLGQDQVVENGYQKPQRHNHVMGRQANQQQSGSLEVKQQFHQERPAIFHIQ